ncbi:MAG: glycosyltransferase family 2 protein [Planctomycetes bacterium]|nr:glycosyltransferase family 2 protein [Planctomycetota bacterium]
MSDRDADVSVVIVSYRSRDPLGNCLRALEPARDEGIRETLIVDNASGDGTAEGVRAGFPWVRLIVNEANRGFATACNQGLRAASGAFLLLLNPDTEVRPGALRTMRGYLAAHPDVGAVGCRLGGRDGRLQTSCTSFPNLLNFAVLSFLPNTRLPRFSWAPRCLAECFDHAGVREVDSVLGAAMMVRRDVLDTVGLLDEGFFLYGEEKDWCYRMWKGGWKVVFLPDAEVVHLGGYSTAQAADSVAFLYAAQRRFLRKHYGLPRCAALVAVFTCGLGLRWLLARLRALLPGGAFARARAERYGLAITSFLGGRGPSDG